MVGMLRFVGILVPLFVHHVVILPCIAYRIDAISAPAPAPAAVVSGPAAMSAADAAIATTEAASAAESARIAAKAAMEAARQANMVSDSVLFLSK